MKNEKPDKIQINAKLSLHAGGGFYLPAKQLNDACKMLEKKDYLTLDGFYCYPVGTLSAILSTYDKDSRVDVYPITHNKRVDYEAAVEDTSAKTNYAGQHPCKYVIMQKYEPVYNVLALHEHGKSSTQRLYSWRRDNITAFVCELTTEEIVINHIVNDPWINKAVIKKIERPDQEKYLKSAGNMATDGYRIHYSNIFTAHEVEWDAPHLMEYIENGRKNPNIVTLDASATKQLLAACKAAIKIKAEGIYLSINGKLDYSASHDDIQAGGVISKGYDHTGEDVTIRINPKYLLDALDKPAAVTIKLKSANQPVYITDGTREAVIMPMHIG